jgi:hypothetical protein
LASTSDDHAQIRDFDPALNPALLPRRFPRRPLVADGTIVPAAKFLFVGAAHMLEDYKLEPTLLKNLVGTAIAAKSPIWVLAFGRENRYAASERAPSRRHSSQAPRAPNFRPCRPNRRTE